MKVQRLEDMSPSGSLLLMQQKDGDIIIVIEQDPDSETFGKGRASVEFCSTGFGGGKSPKTHAALVALIAAMAEDNADVRSQSRSVKT
jgi:hypothetical protein